MHYSMEVIMPPAPVSEIPDILAKALSSFEEVGDNQYGFWDFWVLGGRFSGRKLNFKIPNDQLRAFEAELINRKVLVSDVVCGKETLVPEFIPIVDKLWTEMVPGFGDVCPLFDHYNDNTADITLLFDTPLNMNCSRVMILGNDFHPKFMVVDEIYNGVNLEKTSWEGTLVNALELFSEHYSYQPELVGKDRLCVTVDYHN